MKSFKTRHIINRLIVLFIIAITANTAAAQDYRYEVGIGGGISGYLGDLNQSNVLKNPGMAAEGIFRYLIGQRFAVKGSFAFAQISGDAKQFNNEFPNGKDYKFESNYYDLGASFEFNFLNYGLNNDYRNLKRITPYISLGMGVTYSSGKQFNMNIPIGLGAKFKMAPRWNMGLEMRARMMLGDKIDNHSDLYEVKSSFLKNTDWCPTLMISITYNFGEICKTCHYVD